ncbi:MULTISPECIES: 2-hydroxymuconate tautomerase [Sporosarcina]|uniref:2-hydroxymuconate tautomerase n=1 Tax=Sporosarcina TaxID=1569 RepID=UPI00129BD2D4|nr:MULTISPECIES: 2-hydroxymuconate tautomerase [Sporosarcina]GKV66853.1 putative tautomerase [Sporosarcina sp. NCCP-2331]GLB57262.1 putative tautomerase [Sporosarcina sp. NCCP-2378]
MPIVTVKMFEGRTDEQKRALCEKVTEAVIESVGAPIENVTVIIEEMSKNHMSKAGVRECDK